jgi:hypothetical protein
MSTNCLYAHTGPGFNPAFVNLSKRDNGDVVLTVRSDGSHTPQEIVLDDVVALNLRAALLSAVSQKASNA